MTGFTITSASPAQTNAIGAAVGAHLRAGDLVRLRGELGAGKTAFVRAIASGMGLDGGAVNSPTYTIANEYRGEAGVLLHIDAYRIDEIEETLDTIGWDTISGGEAVVCIEWPELLGEAITGAALDIELTHAGESTRMIAISGPALARGGRALVRSVHQAGGSM